jgi:superfamily II DNA/RNA helicase
VVDEADFFFSDTKNHKELMALHGQLHAMKLKIQYILFSATYPEEVSESISNILEEANQISLKKE